MGEWLIGRSYRMPWGTEVVDDETGDIVCKASPECAEQIVAEHNRAQASTASTDAVREAAEVELPAAPLRVAFTVPARIGGIVQLQPMIHSDDLDAVDPPAHGERAADPERVGE